MFPSLLSHHGILGINARNLLYIRPFNPKKATAFADDKLKTKAFLTARGIPAAKIYGRIETRDQLHSFDFSQLPDSCVLKPNYGFGGEGILVCKGRDSRGNFINTKKQSITKEALIGHIEDILDGKFSLGGRKDTAFFEQILVAHESFNTFRPAGLPDIRIIVFNLVPVMAEVRIPTAESGGKANLHMGGIGLGVDIAKGTTTFGVQYDKIIKEFPFGVTVAGHQIPYWDEMLLICSQIQLHTNIGYLAVDLTIDEHMGPAILEVNARAGLAVQIANLAPLRSRLERVQGLNVGSPEKGVRISQDLFGQKVRITKEKEEKPVLGLHEMLSITGDGTSIEEHCLIATDRERTTFSKEFIEEITGQGALDIEDANERTYRVKFSLGGKKLQTLIAEGESKDGVRIVVGRRDITGFLIDPSKNQKSIKKAKSIRSDMRAVDKLFSQFDKDMLLLKHIKPLNLDKERQRLLEDKKYNPVFSYTPIESDLDEMKKRLLSEKLHDSPMGILLEKKRTELLSKIRLLEARGKDPVEFTLASVELFGKPTSSLVRSATAMIHNREACEIPILPSELLRSSDVKEQFDAVLKKYSLHDWEVLIRPKLVADVTVGGNKVYIREAAVFEPKRIEALIKHEIETHVLTSENGIHQPFELFRRGFANYMETQEGLATYNQNMIYGPHHERRYNAPRNILALEFGLMHSFAETRAYLQDDIGYKEDKAISQAITIKRGLQDTAQPGGFTKGVVYYRGMRAIEKYVADGKDLKRLYVGKIALEDLGLIEKVAGLQQPLLIPEFLRQELK